MLYVVKYTLQYAIYIDVIPHHKLWHLILLMRPCHRSTANWIFLIIQSRLKASLIENFENYEILTNSKFAANINEKVNLIFVQKQDFVFYK